MEDILNKLFTLNSFWSEFKLLKKSKYFNVLSLKYEFKKNGHHIEIVFSQVDELVKSFTLKANKKTVVDYLFFTNFLDLHLILSLVPSIRVAVPLRIDSNQIAVLSSLQQMNNCCHLCPVALKKHDDKERKTYLFDHGQKQKGND